MPLGDGSREGGRKEGREPGDLPGTKVWLMGRGVPQGGKARCDCAPAAFDSPAGTEGEEMSALGKHILEGDFDEAGQVVVQSPAERVIERSVVVTRTVTEAPRPVAVPAPAAKVEAVPQDKARNNAQPPLPGSVRESGSDPKKTAEHVAGSITAALQPPLPYPLAPRPRPSDLKLD